jgi:hypothetical protein
MLTELQVAAIQAIADSGKAKLNPAPEVKKAQTSSSLWGSSSGVAPSSGGVAETKARSDAAVTAALKDASPAEILAVWTAAQVADGGDPNTAFLEAFKSGRK